MTKSTQGFIEWQRVTSLYRRRLCLQKGLIIGTCSSRRKAFLMNVFQDKFKIVDLRGNIDYFPQAYHSLTYNLLQDLMKY